MAAPLTPELRLERLRTDQLLLAALDAADCPVSVTGHRTAEDVRRNRDPVRVGDRNPPTHYRIVYDFDTLSAPGRRHRPTVIHVAPLVSGAYPATPPGAWVVSDVVPWTPHFDGGVPVCHGDHVWIPNRTQLVDYVVHLGKLLNFDEPPPPAGYHGYNSAAIAYWRDTLRLQPLDPGVRFPDIRPEDVVRPGAFAGAATGAPGADRFRAAKGASAAPGAARFRPAAGVAAGRFSGVGVRP